MEMNGILLPGKRDTSTFNLKLNNPKSHVRIEAKVIRYIIYLKTQGFSPLKWHPARSHKLTESRADSRRLGNYKM